MARFCLLITYNGHCYQGWQKQTEGISTIQGEIERALFQVFHQPIRLTGAGRTDAGVHALGQVAHFDWEGTFPKKLSLKKALNAILPPSICIKAVWKVPLCFHALHSALSKSYIYIIWNHTLHNVFWAEQIYHYPYKLNLENLNKMSDLIQGRHDFKSFQNTGTPLPHTVRTVDCTYWLKKNYTFVFYIRGEGFLKQMIRNLVGTQLSLLKKHPDQERVLEKFHTILSAKDRKLAGPTISPTGLYLYKVSYPKELDSQFQLL